MNNTETTLVDFLRPSLYLFDELHPLYVKVANEEKKVYYSLLGKKKKATAVKLAFERTLGLATKPMSEIYSKLTFATKDAPKNYGNGMLKLYQLYVDMIESRISILTMFINEGLTDEVKATNQRELEKCSKYDAQYSIMFDLTQNNCKMMVMMSPYDNIYEFLNDLERLKS